MTKSTDRELLNEAGEALSGMLDNSQWKRYETKYLAKIFTSAIKEGCLPDVSMMVDINARATLTRIKQHMEEVNE